MEEGPAHLCADENNAGGRDLTENTEERRKYLQ